MVNIGGAALVSRKSFIRRDSGTLAFGSLGCPEQSLRFLVINHGKSMSQGRVKVADAVEVLPLLLIPS